jgi:hypothetical protein
LRGGEDDRGGASCSAAARVSVKLRSIDVGSSVAEPFACALQARTQRSAEAGAGGRAAAEGVAVEARCRRARAARERMASEESAGDCSSMRAAERRPEEGRKKSPFLLLELRLRLERVVRQAR